MSTLIHENCEANVINNQPTWNAIHSAFTKDPAQKVSKHDYNYWNIPKPTSSTQQYEKHTNSKENDNRIEMRITIMNEWTCENVK